MSGWRIRAECYWLLVLASVSAWAEVFAAWLDGRTLARLDRAEARWPGFKDALHKRLQKVDHA